MRIRNHFRLLAIALFAITFASATEYHGNVKFGGLPVPGATVTATQGDKKLTVITDPQGAYSFPDLADGSWNIEVDMLCFATIKQDVTVAAGAPASEWELKLLPFDEIKATGVAAPPPPPPSGSYSANARIFDSACDGRITSPQRTLPLQPTARGDFAGPM